MVSGKNAPTKNGGITAARSRENAPAKGTGPSQAGGATPLATGATAAENAFTRAEAQIIEGNYIEAIRISLSGLTEEPARSSEAEAVELYSILGTAYARLGEFDKAADYYVRCYNFDKRSPDKTGLTSSLISIASVYIYAGKPEMAEQYALDAIENERAIGRPDKLARVYGKACDTYNALGREEEALLWAELAVEQAEALDNSTETAIRRSQRANPLLSLGKLKEAEQDLLFAEEVFRGKGLKQSLAITCFQLGQLYRKQNMRQKACAYYAEAATISEEVQDLSLLQNIYTNYAATLSATNPSLAYNLQKKAAYIAEKRTKGASEKRLELLRVEEETANLQQELGRSKTRFFLACNVVVFLAALAILAFVFARRLHRKNAALAQSNKQKDTLFSIISHDLRSPAIAQLSALKMLSQGADNISRSDFKRICIELEREAAAEVDLIENVLRWSRTRVGGKKIEPVWFNVADALKETVAQYAQNAAQKDIHLQCFAPPELLLCTGRDCLLIVLRNLLSNAIKFSFRGGEVSLTAETWEEDATNGKAKDVDSGSREGVCIKVCDHGVGLGPELLAKLGGTSKGEGLRGKSGQKNKGEGLRGKGGQRTENSSITSSRGTEGESGSGLGLIVSKELIEAIGGKINVSSNQAEGTCFSITVPNITDHE